MRQGKQRRGTRKKLGKRDCAKPKEKNLQIISAPHRLHQEALKTGNRLNNKELRKRQMGIREEINDLGVLRVGKTDTQY